MSPRILKRLLALAVAPVAMFMPQLLWAQLSHPVLTLEKQFRAHTLEGEALIQVRFSSASDLFITSASDGKLKLWNAPDSLKQEFTAPNRAMLFNARLDPDDLSVIGAAYNGIAPRWSLDGTPLRTHGPHLSGVTDVEILPGDRGVVTSSDDGSIRFWTTHGHLVHRIPRPGVTRHLDLADSRELLAASQDIGTVTLLTTRGDVLQIFPTSQGRLNDVIFSPDQQFLVTGGFDGTIKFWDVSKTTRPPALVRTIPAIAGAAWIEGLALNRSGLLASASDDGVLRIWSLQGQLLDSIKLSNQHLMSISFSSDGRRLLAAAIDGTVSVLRVGQPR